MNLKKKNLPQKNSSHLTILLIFFIFASVVLCIVLLFNFNTNTKTNSLAQENQALHPNSVGDSRGSGSRDSSLEESFSAPASTPTIAETPSNAGDGVYDNVNKTTQTSTQGKVAILCTEETSIYCLVKKTNPFIEAFDNNLFLTGAIIDGKNVQVERISHQLVFRTLSENNVTDSAGKVLASSSVSYKEIGKELVILVGVDKKYYQSLGVAEQRTLYTSQFVRAIFSVTGEVPSNYPKVSKTVGKLNYWDPNTQ